jgi:cyclohexanecarboxylate-CoA ligase
MEGVFLGPARLAAERRRGVWRGRVLTDYLDGHAAQRPDATAVVAFREESATTTRLTYRELAAHTARTARALHRLGVGRGDVVSFQLPNWWEFFAVHLACVRLGAVSNLLMPIFRHHELSFMLAHAGSKVLVAPARFRGFDHGALARQLARELPQLEHVLLVGGTDEDSFEAHLARADGADFARGAALAPDDVVQLLYTSGTTGEPKGVMHTSNTLIGTIFEFAARLELGPDDVIFMPSPLAHQLGFAYGVTMSILLGIPAVLTDVWSPARAVDLIERERCTFTFAATPFLADLANFPGVEQRDLGRLRVFVSSGAPIPPTVVEAAQSRLQTTVVTCWGMTECMSVTMTPLSGKKVLESDGYALPGEEVRIVGADGREAPRGTPGTLKVRGAALFVGYLKRPQLYDVDEDGWFDTGDLARMDEEGYIRICGRKKDIVIRGGENIPVVEVECALYRMPEVAEAAIVAMPDPRLVERACAFVTLRDGASLDLERVRAHLDAEGVAKHFWPERLEILDAMPRTPTGKIQKFVLRERASRLAPPEHSAGAAALPV